MQDQFGWWFSTSSKSYDAHEHTTLDIGYQESLEVIINALSREKYDGILAFSQGASLAAHLCVLQQTQKIKPSFRYFFLKNTFKNI